MTRRFPPVEIARAELPGRWPWKTRTLIVSAATYFDGKLALVAYDADDGQPYARITCNAHQHHDELLIHHDVAQLDAWLLDLRNESGDRVLFHTGRTLSYGRVRDRPVYRLRSSILADITRRAEAFMVEEDLRLELEGA